MLQKLVLKVLKVLKVLEVLEALKGRGAGRRLPIEGRLTVVLGSSPLQHQQHLQRLQHLQHLHCYSPWRSASNRLTISQTAFVCSSLRTTPRLAMRAPC